MNNKLINWRKQIDILDEKILIALAKRAGITRKIGRFKKKQKMSILDKKRRGDILKSNLKKAQSLGLSKNFIKNLLTSIHKYSLTIQEES